MTEDDIYKSKERYTQLIAKIEEFTKKPKKKDKKKYYCKNVENLKYFRILINHFDTKEYRIVPLYLALREGEKESAGKIDHLLHGVYVKE